MCLDKLLKMHLPVWLFKDGRRVPKMHTITSEFLELALDVTSCCFNIKDRLGVESQELTLIKTNLNREREKERERERQLRLNL